MFLETIKVLEFAVPCERDSPATWKRKQNAWTELKTMGLGNNVDRCCLLWNRPESCCLNNRYLRTAS